MAALRPLMFALLGLTLVGNAHVADAAKIYRWTDRNGVSHYGDRAPDEPKTQVKVVRAHVEPTAIARLRLQNEGAENLAWVDNSLAGPIEVRLRSGRGDIASDPLLPARATVAALSSTLVAHLDATQSGELWLDALPGDPNARPKDVVYLLPLRQDAFRIDQGYGGSFSHVDAENRYAVDFAAQIGTPVLAAREGVVMQVESDFSRAGLKLEKYGGRANLIRIVHADGTMAVYAHLKVGGVLVRVGQRVRAGQQIGLSGNTGFTTGPHLHFAVQVNRGMRLESLPFRMTGPRGPLRIAGGP
jgi:murein DD-endopeptidase MepM/ murein hydrolase activator NlpD